MTSRGPWVSCHPTPPLPRIRTFRTDEVLLSPHKQGRMVNILETACIHLFCVVTVLCSGATITHFGIF
ncbi:hypothetical protein BDZ94DRAFT_254481 [Collybia nuda]|uniref:Uncharacterized protein n=1 Tax=Collybia nuda TaxID=64659 RepID=A0A9P6C9L5_9AGAR|nr:hypothetical protein BDZ94DRAFT_254481 [Collybia nuda]